jgi:peptide-methionine (R)-S-oxide reductase
MKIIIILITILSLSACKSTKDSNVRQEKADAAIEVQSENDYVTNKFGNKLPLVIKSEEEWKESLSDQEFYVLRKKGTERAFTSELNDNKKGGLYMCAGCNTVLFTSSTKFDSGTGWPSFYRPEDKNLIKEDTDYNLGYARTEVLCARCGGHLGHVFPDGPKPTGLRYCINGVALDFIPEEN